MRLILLTFLVLCPRVPLIADDSLPAAVLDRIKQATVYIRVQATNLSGAGSGFLIKADGKSAYLVTNHHVVYPKVEVETVLRPPGLPLGGPFRPPITVPPVTITRVIVGERPAVNVVFFSGTRKEKQVRAEIVGSDDLMDLAVLKVPVFDQMPSPIDISGDFQPVETMTVFIIGFPLGEKLGELMANSKGNPTITIGKGSVTSLPLNNKGELAYVQFDGSLNPGNSGGPVVDSQGRLVGVAVSSIVDGMGGTTGINKAIPTREVNQLLQGHVGTPRLQLISRDKERLKIQVELELCDPFSKIKSVAFHYSTKSADKTLVDKKTIAMKIDQRKAVGELDLPETSEGAISFQTEYIIDASTPILTEVRTSRMARPTLPMNAETERSRFPSRGFEATRSSLPPPKTPPAVSQLDGLLGYWSFDDNDVARIPDQSSKKHDANGKAVTSVEGIRGKAIQFQGYESHVDLGDVTDFNIKKDSPFTIACWMKSKATSGVLLAFRSSRDDGAVIAFGIERGVCCATVRQDRALMPGQIRSRYAVNDDQWHHLVLTRAGNVITLFVDGQSQGEAARTGLNEAITCDWRFLGKERRWESNGQRTFNGVKGCYEGAIDELCILNRVLTYEEIKTISGR